MQRAAQHPDWVLGFADETWWSRLAHPLRLVEQAVAKGDPDPKALCCYGMWRTDQKHIRLRFVEGRPVSRVTTAFLGWLAPQMAAEHKRVLVLIWDKASWHLSREVRSWMRQYTQQAKQHVSSRTPPCCLPVKRPWLNPLEPRRISSGPEGLTEPFTQQAGSMTASTPQHVVLTSSLTSSAGPYMSQIFIHAAVGV